MPKAAAVVLADTDTPEALGRVVNGLTTAKEFKERGDDVVVIFDGAGTKWVRELSRADHDYHSLFEDVRDSIAGACGYCAQAFGVREQVEETGIRLLEEYSGHPSLRKLMADGYAVITF